jgi:CelD/BcsL family acetyltransferase involved in cellulose biosynthesis
MPFDAIPRSTWDRILALTPSATPFSSWVFHRAWWDAYDETAEPRYLVACRPGSDEIVAIVPLMRRATTDPVAEHRPHHTLFMAASYHADYATVLCAPVDLPGVASAVGCALRDDPAEAWDAIDLRRLRHADPALPALEAGFRAAGKGWQVRVEREDVCPVVTTPPGGEWEDYLATLDKKARHEIRRKLRRAEAVGPVRFRELPLEAASVDSFIDLHQARWGDQGLFPDTPDGERSRRFLHRLTALAAAEGARAQLVLGEVTVGERVVFSTVSFDDGRNCYFYNAGMDPSARELSPGVTGTAAFLRDRMAAGRERFDFLRGNEPYKYEWGAVDEPVDRIVVTRP